MLLWGKYSYQQALTSVWQATLTDVCHPLPSWSIGVALLARITCRPRGLSWRQLRPSLLAVWLHSASIQSAWNAVKLQTFTISIKLRNTKWYSGTRITRLSLVAHTWLALQWLDKLVLHATEVTLLRANCCFQLLRALLRSTSSRFSSEREYSAALSVGVAFCGYYYTQRLLSVEVRQTEEKVPVVSRAYSRHHSVGTEPVLGLLRRHSDAAGLSGAVLGLALRSVITA